MHLQRLESGSSKGITPTCRSFVPLGCRAETVMKPLDGSVSVCVLFFFLLKERHLIFSTEKFHVFVPPIFSFWFAENYALSCFSICPFLFFRCFPIFSCRKICSFFLQFLFNLLFFFFCASFHYFHLSIFAFIFMFFLHFLSVCFLIFFLLLHHFSFQVFFFSFLFPIFLFLFLFNLCLFLFEKLINSNS